MKPQVRLCPHLSEPTPGKAPFAIAPDEILEACDGPVVAIVRCRACAACGWIEMLDWSLDRSVRVYAVAGIDAADVAVYFRNRRSGSCDIDRAGRERDALGACAGPFVSLVAYLPSSRRVLAAAPYPPSRRQPHGHGAERLPASTDATWFDVLGVLKCAPEGGGGTRPPMESGPVRTLARIVSGGQTGADRAALDVALALGLEVGGWVPKGRRAEDGRIPERYPNLRETDSEEPAERTLRNVRDSDATLLLSHGPLAGGSLLTLAEAQRTGRPVLHLDLDAVPASSAARRLRTWLEEHRIATLNVAGPRASEDPAIAGATAAALRAALRRP